MIRVIIDRRIKQGRLNEYHHLIRAARKQLINNIDGFIAGEVLEEKANPNHAIIISSWENYSHWEKWNQSAQRVELKKQIAPLLESPEQVTLLEGCQINSLNI